MRVWRIRVIHRREERQAGMTEPWREERLDLESVFTLNCFLLVRQISRGAFRHKLPRAPVWFHQQSIENPSDWLSSRALSPLLWNLRVLCGLCLNHLITHLPVFRPIDPHCECSTTRCADCVWLLFSLSRTLPFCPFAPNILSIFSFHLIAHAAPCKSRLSQCAGCYEVSLSVHLDRLHSQGSHAFMTVWPIATASTFLSDQGRGKCQTHIPSSSEQASICEWRRCFLPDTYHMLDQSGKTWGFTPNPSGSQSLSPFTAQRSCITFPRPSTFSLVSFSLSSFVPFQYHDSLANSSRQLCLVIFLLLLLIPALFLFSYQVSSNFKVFPAERQRGKKHGFVLYQGCLVPGSTLLAFTSFFLIDLFISSFSPSL